MPPRPPLVEIDCHLVDPSAPAEVDFYGGCNRSNSVLRTLARLFARAIESLIRVSRFALTSHQPLLASY